SPESGSDDPPRAHQLEIRRPGMEQSRVVVLEKPDATLIPETVFGVARQGEGDWDYLISPNDGLCYARIGQITVNSHAELQVVLNRIEAHKYRGLILDLRWCPGGTLTGALAIARS